MSSADQERYTLAGLAAASGISPRTIRYYTAEGLLPPPGERGRYAIYTAGHLRRLQSIGRLKAAYLPLAAIRERLALPGDTQVASDGPVLPPMPHEPASGFGFRVSASLGDSPGTHTPEARPANHSKPIGYAALFPYPDDDQTSGDVTSAESGEHYQRVTLAPGVELHLRAPISPERQEQIDRLIAEARALLSDK